MNKDKVIRFCRNAMETDRRQDGSEFIKFNEESEFKPYWDSIKDILYKQGFEIEDFYYDKLEDGFHSISDFLENNELEDIDSFDIYEYAECDIYTADLLNWISGSITRQYYIDEVINEGVVGSFVELLQYGQLRHIYEIYGMALAVVRFLIDED